MLALDTETFLIGPYRHAPDMVCTSWAGEDLESGVWHHADPALLGSLRRAFEGETVWCNGPFDFAVLANAYPDLLPVIFDALEEGRAHDVQTGQKLIDLAEGTFRWMEDEDGERKYKSYALADMVHRATGQRMDKDTYRLKYHTLHGVPLEQWPDGARQYAADDAVATMFMHKRQVGHTALADAAAQTRAHFALHLASCHGFATDPAHTALLKEQTERVIEAIKGQLIEDGLVRLDGTRDTKAAIRRMLGITGPGAKLTTAGEEKLAEFGERDFWAMAQEKGKFISVSRETCDEVGDPALIRYAQYTKFKNLLSGSIKHFSRPVVQTRFDPLKETGRTGSSGPNIQNVRGTTISARDQDQLPEGLFAAGESIASVRGCFRARPGYALVAADYSSAELHTLAEVCNGLFGYSKLGELLLSGTDVHSHMAGQIIAPVPFDRDDDPDKIRTLGKAVNFGFPGGCGPQRFVILAKGYGKIISVREAARLKAVWQTAYPEITELHRYVGRCEDPGGLYWVEQLDGRLRSGCTFTSACNSHFQGPAATAIKAACWELTRAMYPGNTRMVNMIHDEIILETPLHNVDACAKFLSDTMERTFAKICPTYPTRAEAVAMLNWDKGAKPVFSGDLLVPWEPDIEYTKDAQGRLIAA